MTLWEDIKEIESGPHELRQFATVMTVALCVIGAILYWLLSDVYTTLFVVAGFFAAPALVDKVTGAKLCIILWPIQKVWMALAVTIGFLMSRVILGGLFYLVFSPIGLISRLVGRPLLDITRGTRVESYWIYRKSGLRDSKRCEKQY